MKFYPLFFFLITCCFNAYNQSISGVVNSYTEVTSVSTNSVQVASTLGFLEGDKVLVIQMKGATITTGNISDFGIITSLNNAGNFEFRNIESIVGPIITFESDLCESYEISGHVQLVKVPVYSDVTISGALTAEAWNGSSGGVLAIEATNSITFNSDIINSGLGFTGGDVYTGSFGCGDSNWATTSSGKKGEGIAEAPMGQEGNRAPLANGGGGSNTGNPGAGGGGNGGAGGRGGNEWYGSCPLNVSFGLGGYNIDYAGYRAFLGGGGGGGYRDNNLNATAGSNGGGITFVISPTINGNGHTIDASGADVIGNSDSEGAGGGGAGGCVYLLTENLNSSLNINVKGGKGGDILSTLWSSACHGPGGGGGGGAIVLSSSIAPVNLTSTINGGASGNVLHTGPPCAGTSHGALPGFEGQVLFDYEIHNDPDLGEDTTLCLGETINLSLNSTYISYLWSDGSTGSSLSVDSEGIYWVDVELNCGVIRDSIVVNQNSINLGVDQEICPGSEIVLDVPAEFTVQVWNTGEVSQSIMIDTTGIYAVTVIDSNDCVLVDSILISVLPVISSFQFVSICSGSGFDFNGDTLYNSGLYVDTMISAVGGCDSIINLNLIVNLLPDFSVIDTSVCYGSEIQIIPQGAFSYQWLTDIGTIQSDGSLVVIGDQTTLFSVVAINEFNCSSVDSVLLTVFSIPDVPFVTEDAKYCMNELPLGIEATGGSGSYIWYSDEELSQVLSLSNSYVPDLILGSTVYYVTSIENGCESAPELVSIFFEECEIIIPTAITPDNDQINDFWKLENIDMLYPENVVSVYNRWGNKIYESTPGDYNSRSWNGYLNGDLLPLSSYHYIIEFNDDFTKPKTGIVSIIK